jgi:hypothetical protein
MRCNWWAITAVVAWVTIPSAAEPEWLTTGKFEWLASDELVRPATRSDDPCISIKDPSVVFHDGKWHLFCTVRGNVRTHQVEYLSFAEWKDADRAERHVLKMHGGYFCAPQVFYFTPNRKWYLICQAADETWEPKYQPAFSTSDDVSDPTSWTPLKPLYLKAPDVNSWLDFWIICDERDAHLFYTSLDGKMWRARTPLAEFPHGWSKPAKCLEGDVYEASHTYKLKGLDQYLTLIEAQDGGRRYFKAYLATTLDGEWRELAASRAQPFASRANVRFNGRRWTDSISHGELLRAGYDEKLEVDPANLRFLFQGVSDVEKAGKPYGEIPWRLGMLDLATGSSRR